MMSEFRIVVQPHVYHYHRLFPLGKPFPVKQAISGRDCELAKEVVALDLLKRQGWCAQGYFLLKGFAFFPTRDVVAPARVQRMTPPSAQRSTEPSVTFQFAPAVINVPPLTGLLASARRSYDINLCS